MTFNHEFIDTGPPLERVEQGGKRFYQIPTGELVPSVTTVLSKLSKAGIDKWKAKVGAQEAESIVNAAASRGTIIHDLCEQHLNNRELPLGVMPHHKATFITLRDHVDKHVTTIYGIETRLYSKKYLAAGTADCICLYDGIPTIVDFKTSRKMKREDWILGYNMQATIYGMMVKELYGINIGQICVIVAVDGEIRPQVFLSDFDKYWAATDKFFMDHAVDFAKGLE